MDIRLEIIENMQKELDAAINALSIINKSEQETFEVSTLGVSLGAIHLKRVIKVRIIHIQNFFQLIRSNKTLQIANIEHT